MLADGLSRCDPARCTGRRVTDPPSAGSCEEALRGLGIPPNAFCCNGVAPSAAELLARVADSKSWLGMEVAAEAC